MGRYLVCNLIQHVLLILIGNLPFPEWSLKRRVLGVRWGNRRERQGGEDARAGGGYGQDVK